VLALFVVKAAYLKAHVSLAVGQFAYRAAIKNREKNPSRASTQG
jgi:hypothetical protein